MHIGHVHPPPEGRSGLPATEVEVTVCWISQPPLSPELVVAITSPEWSSSPSSSVLRLRSMTSSLVVPSVEPTRCGPGVAAGSSSPGLPGR